METFGSQLRSARKKAGLKASDLASALDVSRPYITNVEKGLKAPLTHERLYQLEFTGIETAQLHKAAAAQRGHVRLELDGDALQLDIASRIAHLWPTLTDEDLERIAKALDNGD